MKHNAPTITQVHAADPQRIVELMTPKPVTLAAKYLAPHPHGTVDGFVIARPKGILQCR